MYKKAAPQNVVPTESIPRHYSVHQLEQFGRDMEPFYKEKDVPSLADRKVTEKVRILNIKDAAVWFGAMSRHTVPYLSYEVILGGQPTKWDIFMDKLEQWEKMKGKRAFASEKAAEQYETMAEQALGAMQYTPDEPTMYDESLSDEPVKRLTTEEVDAKMEANW